MMISVRAWVTRTSHPEYPSSDSSRVKNSLSSAAKTPSATNWREEERRRWWLEGPAGRWDCFQRSRFLRFENDYELLSSQIWSSRKRREVDCFSFLIFLCFFLFSSCFLLAILRISLVLPDLWLICWFQLTVWVYSHLSLLGNVCGSHNVLDVFKRREKWWVKTSGLQNCRCCFGDTSSFLSSLLLVSPSSQSFSVWVVRKCSYSPPTHFKTRQIGSGVLKSVTLSQKKVPILHPPSIRQWRNGQRALISSIYCPPFNWHLLNK